MDTSMHIQCNKGIITIGKKYSKKEASAKGYRFFTTSNDGDIYDKWIEKFHTFALII